MQIRQKYETDGRCFAKRAGGCVILGEEVDDKQCGTYMCINYKPDGCKDWIRIDSRNGLVRLYPPEEVTSKWRR